MSFEGGITAGLALGKTAKASWRDWKKRKAMKERYANKGKGLSDEAGDTPTTEADTPTTEVELEVGAEAEAEAEEEYSPTSVSDTLAGLNNADTTSEAPTITNSASTTDTTVGTIARGLGPADEAPADEAPAKKSSYYTQISEDIQMYGELGDYEAVDKLQKAERAGQVADRAHEIALSAANVAQQKADREDRTETRYGDQQDNADMLADRNELKAANEQLLQAEGQLVDSRIMQQMGKGINPTPTSLMKFFNARKGKDGGSIDFKQFGLKELNDKLASMYGVDEAQAAFTQKKLVKEIAGLKTTEQVVDKMNGPDFSPQSYYEFDVDNNGEFTIFQFADGVDDPDSPDYSAERIPMDAQTFASEAQWQQYTRKNLEGNYTAGQEILINQHVAAKELENELAIAAWENKGKTAESIAALLTTYQDSASYAAMSPEERTEGEGKKIKEFLSAIDRVGATYGSESSGSQSGLYQNPQNYGINRSAAVTQPPVNNAGLSSRPQPRTAAGGMSW